MTTSQLARIGAFSLIVSLSVAPVAFAHHSDNHIQGPDSEPAMVTICHANNAANKPYVQQTVAVSSVDGSSGRGNGDHYLEHTGPVYSESEHSQKDRGWGDIIPPFDTDGNEYTTPQTSLNWPSGKAIWENDCVIITSTPGSGNGNPTPTISISPDPTPTATPVIIGSGSVLAAQAPATELPKTGTSFINLIVAFAAAIGAGLYSHLRGFSKVN